MKLPDLGAAGDTPVGGLAEVRPGLRGAQLVHRSDLGLAEQVTARGATWLDRQLLAREPAALAGGGFGAEVRRALEARAAHLVEIGMATRSGGSRPTFVANLLGRLRALDLGGAGARLARETGLRFEDAVEDPQVRGVYRRRIDLASGRFAMVEDGLGFRLVPWARALDRRLGQAVSGVLSQGGVEWDLGRARGPGR